MMANNKVCIAAERSGAKNETFEPANPANPGSRTTSKLCPVPRSGRPSGTGLNGVQGMPWVLNCAGGCTSVYGGSLASSETVSGRLADWLFAGRERGDFEESK